MKLLLLCLGLSLVCVHSKGSDNAVKSDFNIQKVSGDWFSILLASDRREKIEETGSMRVFVDFFHVFDNSSLYFRFHKVIDGQCTALDLVADETEEKGTYKVDYDGNNTFEILEAVYDKYIIFHLTNFNHGATFQLMELYGREKDLDQEVREKFVEYCKQHRIPVENIIDLVSIDRCLQERTKEEDQDFSDE